MSNNQYSIKFNHNFIHHRKYVLNTSRFFFISWWNFKWYQFHWRPFLNEEWKKSLKWLEYSVSTWLEKNRIITLFLTVYWQFNSGCFPSRFIKCTVYSEHVQWKRTLKRIFWKILQSYTITIIAKYFFAFWLYLIAIWMYRKNYLNVLQKIKGLQCARNSTMQKRNHS